MWGLFDAYIDSNLASAEIVLLLVSADFLASDYCYDKEMKLALDRHEAGDAFIVPIILRPVDWSTAPFAKLQALPKDAKPVTLWANRDEAFANISQGIRGLVTRIAAESNQETVSLNDESSGLRPQGRSCSRSEFPEKASQVVQFHELLDHRQLISNLQSVFGERFQSPTSHGDFDSFDLRLNDIPLQGTDEPIPCYVPRMESESISRILKRLAEKVRFSFGLIFMPSLEMLETAVGSMADRRIVIFGPQAITTMLRSASPVSSLVNVIRQQIGRLRLNPYHVANPAGPNMFFGRQNELLRMSNDLRSHFALVGPSRVGKSSLLKQYIWQVRQVYPQQPIYYMDAFYCRELDLDECAREIAIHIKPSNAANRVNSSTIFKFLRYQAKELKQPLELLIDECDAICSLPILDYLGEAAKEGYIRLILSGRQGLFQYCKDKSSSFALRLELLMLGPLEPPAARQLLTNPMAALGLVFESEDCIDYCCQMAGYMPDLLQFYGRALVESATKLQHEKLTKQMVRDVETNAAISIVGAHSLEIERVPFIRALILSLSDMEMNISQLADALDRKGFQSTDHEIQNACDYLFINGILAFDGKKVRLANGFLRRIARRLRH